MYNSHRGMVPAPNNRLTELLDQVRAEFENQHNRNGEYEHQRRFAVPLTTAPICASLLDARSRRCRGPWNHFSLVLGYLIYTSCSWPDLHPARGAIDT